MAILKLEAPEELLRAFLDNRRITGGDRWDEVWEGELHLVPSPSRWHQRLEHLLENIFEPLEEARGLEVAHELSLYRPGAGDQDYRTPDLMVYAPPKSGNANVERAELVVEILSPGDESRRKLPFYFSVGVREVLLVEPDTRVPELHRPDGSVARDRVRAEVLGCSFEVVAGPKLRVSWEGGEALV